MRRIIAVCAVVPVAVAAAVWSQESQENKFTIETVGIQPSGDQRAIPDGTMLPVLSHNEYTLLVEDLKIGDGPECSRASEITFHYHGMLGDDTVFESSWGKEPISYPVNRLIPGWQAGVPGMKVGGIRRLVIPPIMAYGSKDRVDPKTGKVTIPANSTLTFIIQLVAVKAAPDQAATPAGLKIEDLVVGTGEECPRGATVEMHYRGTLADGTPFDASEPNQPLLCSLKPGGTPEAMGVITGWQEGVPGMKVGGKRRLTIPAHMAYGAQGRPGIPPHATLIFEVELVDVK